MDTHAKHSQGSRHPALARLSQSRAYGAAPHVPRTSRDDAGPPHTSIMAAMRRAMTWAMGFLLMVVAGAAMASRPGAPSSVYQPPVVALSDVDFDAVVGAPGTRWLVEFYADWCGHCAHLAPTVQALADRLQSGDRGDDGDGDATVPRGWRVAVVDVDRSPGLAVRFQVAAIPRVFTIDDGAHVRALPLAQHGSDLANALASGAWQTEPASDAGWLHPLSAPYVPAARRGPPWSRWLALHSAHGGAGTCMLGHGR
jgi:thiol-disulfide isomerase/thioredoxin